MRDPSIHITKHQFEKILSQLEVYNFPIDAFFVIARKEVLKLIYNTRYQSYQDLLKLRNSLD